MKTILSLILVTVIACAAVFAIRAGNRIKHSEATLAALGSQRTDLQAKVARMKQRLQDAEKARTELEKRIADAQAARRAAEAAAPPAITPRRINPEAEIANNPTKLAAYSKDFRECVDWDDGRMAKTIGLSAEQFEKYKDIKVWSEQRRLDVIAVAAEKGLSGNGSVYKALQERDEAEEAKKIAELLGNKTEPYREYNRTQPTRKVVERLASTAIYPDAPLNSTQLERVTQILAANSRRSPNGTVEPFAVSWDAANGQLQNVISPSQLESLQQVFQTRQLADQARSGAQKEVNRIMAQFRAGWPRQ